MARTDFPRFPLANLPTPLQRAERLERALGPNSPRILIKRDDLTGLAYGGNKARKLEYLVADALAQGATALVTEGAVQSNHARMTAAAAVLAGLKGVLILDARHGRTVAGNLLLDHLMGAEIHLEADGEARAARMRTIGQELAERGERAYVISTGGSTPVGSLGYHFLALELLQQVQAMALSPRAVYFPTGSHGTHAGMIVGGAVFNAPWRAMAVAVEPLGGPQPAALHRLLAESAALLEFDHQFTDEDVRIETGFAGSAYAVPTRAGLEAIQLLAKTEAVFLDPVYSGKAMAGLLAHIREGRYTPEDTVVFIHTGGGPSLFVHTDLLQMDPASLPE